MMAFGAMEIVLSQFPNSEKVTILSVIATATSFIYSLVALGLSVAKLSTYHELRGSTLVANVGEDIASLTKVWHVFQALGNIAFAYTYSWLLLEIQVCCYQFDMFFCFWNMILVNVSRNGFSGVLNNGILWKCFKHNQRSNLEILTDADWILF